MANENLANKIEQAPKLSKPETFSDTVIEKRPETAVENITEKAHEKEGVVSQEKNEGASPSQATAPASDTLDSYHQKREQEIDAFLSDGLSETFLAMSPDKQKIFKDEGEKTAKKINVLLDATKINLNKIVDLIRRWLSLITGVNRFFLDQEAKIKADKIIKIKNKI